VEDLNSHHRTWCRKRVCDFIMVSRAISL